MLDKDIKALKVEIAALIASKARLVRLYEDLRRYHARQAEV
ncbi:hypothetical protein LCGC14_0209670 [marine sediment metagenome]|uniref:Uncharacterized protein n=1 Tax=marine sediment metagenome TaxID=412755 RepID=A0A0F9X140_9ZZZZ